MRKPAILPFSTRIVAALLISLSAACATAKLSKQTRAASYSVPVEERLKKYSKFDLSEVTIERDKDLLIIKYVLPRELTGKANAVEFKGKVPKSGRAVLTGKNGKMECKSAGDLSSCEVAYKDVNFDPAARTEVLKSIAKTPEELAQREAVAVAFHSGGEPHGILHVYNYDPNRTQGYEAK